MTQAKKIIIKAVVIFPIVWLAGIVIHELFLNLEYEILRSFIVAAGAAAGYYMIKLEKI